MCSVVSLKRILLIIDIIINRFIIKEISILPSDVTKWSPYIPKTRHGRNFNQWSKFFEFLGCCLKKVSISVKTFKDWFITATRSIFLKHVLITGNFMTIATLCNSSSSVRTHATTAFVVSLAVSDLFFCASIVPYYVIERLILLSPFTDEKCMYLSFFIYLNVCTSILLLTTITINRWVIFL